MDCPVLECPEIEEVSIPQDGCCSPNPCNIKFEDVLCGLTSLLPPGKAWQDCCGDGNRAKFFEAVARELHKTQSEGFCCVQDEFDPCAATENSIDCWSNLYGLPDECFELAGLLEGEDRENALQALLCAKERASFGGVANACFFTEIAATLGLEIEVHAPGIVNQSGPCCFYSYPSDAVPDRCSNTCGGPVSVPTGCTTSRPVALFKIVTEENPVFACPPMSDQPLCRYPLTELMRCIIENYAPAHVYSCII